MSPTVSEASAADVFFSPAETFTSNNGEGTPKGNGTPSLGSLLEEDRQADESVPQLSALLEEDEQVGTITGPPANEEADDGEETMDFTQAVGGIFRNASADAGSLAEAAFASVSAAAANDAGNEEQEEVEMEMTMEFTKAVGGILRTSDTPKEAHPASSSNVHTPAAQHSLTEDNGYGDEFGVSSGGFGSRGAASAGAMSGPKSGGTPGWLKEASHEVRRLSVAPQTLGMSHLDNQDEGSPADDGSNGHSSSNQEASQGVALDEPPLAMLADSSRADAPADMAQEEPEPIVCAPPVEQPSRRKSLSHKLAEISGAISGRVLAAVGASSAAASYAPPAPPADKETMPGAALEIAPVAASAMPMLITTEPEAPAPSNGEPTSEAADGSQSGPTTFEEFLAEAGVHFLEAGGARASLGKSLAYPFLDSTDAEAPASFSEQLLAVSVLDGDLTQLQWAGGELLKCIDVLKGGYQEMEDYVAQEYPGFFADPENRVPAPDLKRLKNRCRHIARALWYDWRLTLEDDTKKKLERQFEDLQRELASIANLHEAATKLEHQIAATMPPASVAEEAAAAANESRDVANALALKQTEVARMESAQMALQQQFDGAERELLAAKDMTRSGQTRLLELTAAVTAKSTTNTAESSGTGTCIDGDELLLALFAGLDWKAKQLLTDGFSFTFGEPAVFELRVNLSATASPAAKVTSIDLLVHSGTYDVGEEGAAHQVVRSVFFARTSRELRPMLDSVKAISGLPKLMQAVSLRLGRLGELVDEVQDLENSLPAEQFGASFDADSSGVAISMGYSFFGIRSKFVLHLLITSLDPNVPLAWQLAFDDVCTSTMGHQQTNSTSLAGVDNDDLRQRIGAIVDAYSRGFGRLRAIHAAMLKSFTTNTY